MASDEACSNSNGSSTQYNHEDIMHPDDFYKDADKYWKTVPSTVDGMLGGFGKLSATDLTTSKKFLLPFIQGSKALVSPNIVLDCGAGIGRVTKGLLLPLFAEVDLVEQNPAFLKAAKEFLGPGASRVENYFPIGLQNFTPEEGRYDVIWMQWVLSHLTDDDLVAFLKRCVKGLNPKGGLIIAKENIAGPIDIVHSDDSSMTRSTNSFLKVFERAGLTVINQINQDRFPQQLYKITMFALR